MPTPKKERTMTEEFINRRTYGIHAHFLVNHERKEVILSVYPQTPFGISPKAKKKSMRDLEDIADYYEMKGYRTERRA